MKKEKSRYDELRMKMNSDLGVFCDDYVESDESKGETEDIWHSIMRIWDACHYAHTELEERLILIERALETIEAKAMLIRRDADSGGDTEWY